MTSNFEPIDKTYMTTDKQKVERSVFYAYFHSVIIGFMGSNWRLKIQKKKSSLGLQSLLL